MLTIPALRHLFAAGTLVLTCCLVASATETVPLSTLDLTKMSAGWGKPLANQSVVGKGLSLGGRSFATGVGTHANSTLHVKLDGKTERFTATVGVDEETKGKGSVQFMIYGDGTLLFDSGVIRGGDPPKQVDVKLAGIENLVLMAHGADRGIRYDHADWAEASFVVAGAKPQAVDAPQVSEERVMLTPKPDPAPKINGPRLFGVRPGRPFIYRIPCTGERPITFAVDNLPEGLSLDPATGIITGRVPQEPRRYKVTLKASNDHGNAQREFTIAVGDTLALTPPMGWNSWYIHYHRVADKHMREAADVMIDSGMADYGYMYVNIDDCWMKRRGDEPYRDAQGAVLSNAKFPDMKAMTDYIHSKGLRAGLYTSPGPWTCAKYVGAYQHEEIDAKKFTEWGFDFLKYDWCTYSRVSGKKTIANLKKPYQKMGDILKTLDRDIVLNLCQYGMGEVWKWGGEVGGHCWRTTGDLGGARRKRLPGFFRIGLRNAQIWQYAKPGCWNDPDYILIGWVGDAWKKGQGQPTTLTPNEQYSYMSMWSLMAAPLIFSGDMAKLDEFTLNVLCNAEVIEVNQDPLGKQARIVRQDSENLVMAKPLEDGSLAVGLFNLGKFEREMSIDWAKLGLSGPQNARDLWRQKDLGSFTDKFTATVPRHGMMMVRLVRVAPDGSVNGR